jgi:transposase
MTGRTVRADMSEIQAVGISLFGLDAAHTEAAPAVDLKVLHAKIGELTLEKDVLAGALSTAGLLSAKR